MKNKLEMGAALRLHFTQAFCGFFRGRVIDIEAGPPLKTGYLRYPRYKLDMPMKIELDRIPIGSALGLHLGIGNCVEEKVVRGVIEAFFHARQHILHNNGEMVKHLMVAVGKTVVMIPRRNKYLEGEPGGEGGYCYKLLASYDNSFTGFEFLLDQVAKQTTFLLAKMLLGGI